MPFHRIGRFMFDADLETAERAVRSNLKVPVSQNQYDALVDFAFNAGAGALASSRMLAYINAGKFDAAADAFATTRITPKSLEKGLKNRRADEEDIFLMGGSVPRYRWR